jgi:hypothetical protein
MLFPSNLTVEQLKLRLFHDTEEIKFQPLSLIIFALRV